MATKLFRIELNHPTLKESEMAQVFGMEELTLETIATIDIENEKIAIEPTGDSLIREKKRILMVIASRLEELLPENAVLVFGSAEVGQVIS